MTFTSCMDVLMVIYFKLDERIHETDIFKRRGTQEDKLQ